MNFREGVREAFVQLARLVLYPVSFLARFFARSLLLICTAAPIGLPLLALVGLYQSLSDHEALELDFEFTKYKISPLRAVAYLIGAAIFAGIMKMMSSFAWKEARDFGAAVWDVLRTGWLPSWEIKKAFVVTWRCNLAKIPGKTEETLKSAWRLTSVLTAIVLLTVVAYPFFDFPVRPFVLVDVGDTDTETRQVIKKLMRSSSIFSLVHADDVQPDTGKGICLGPSRQKWLTEFRAAITNCLVESKDLDPPVFKITGYASITPMHVGGDTSESARLKCKIANWRAAAVGDFLANPNEEGPGTRWRCDDVKNAFNKTAPNDDNQCGEHYDGPKDQEGNPFLVKVHQWRTPSGMAGHKPVDDGERSSPRRYMEILDHEVRIGVPDDFCAAVAQEAAP